MKKILNLYSKSLLSKLALIAILIVGGGNSAWADDIIIDGNSINTESWNTSWGNYTSSWNTSNSGYCQASTWAYFVLVSKNTFNMSSKKIVISARGIGSSAEITIKTSTTGNTKDDTFTTHKSYTSDDLGTSSSNDFRSFEINDISSTCYILIFAKGVHIQSMSIETLSNPILSVTPNESASFGSVSANSLKTYTVSNTGAGAMTVNFTNTNTDDFSILNSSDEVISSLSDIVNGSPQTFKIRFNYDSEKLGDKSATITVTPTYNENDAIQITATATARSDNDPELSLSPDEDFDFGSLTANASKTYTVTNTGTGNLSVTITSSNSDDFTLSSDDFTESTTTIEGIATGESAEFTVTFNYTCAIANFGEHHSTITVTPSYDEGEAKSFVVSTTSTADVVLDENNSTSWTSGSGKSVLVKYQPVAGWNTLIVPIPTSTNIPSIFGNGAKIYTLKDYDDGTLTFEKVSTYLGSNSPCLVYVENAQDNSAGILLTDVYVFQASTATPGSKTPTGTTATFRGTYVTKTYNEATDVETPWYGVTPSGKVMKAGAGANIKGYRAYFTGISAPSTPGARITIVFEDGGETTDLGFVKMVDPEATDVYTLSGQKVKKGSKGIYIVNGRKVVIK